MKTKILVLIILMVLSMFISCKIENDIKNEEEETYNEEVSKDPCYFLWWYICD